MNAPDRTVSVTVTPDGMLTDVTIGGVSIAHAIPREAASLVMASGGRPQLSIVLVPDEIIVTAAKS